MRLPKAVRSGLAWQKWLGQAQLALCLQPAHNQPHLEESSDVEWCPLRYDMASIRTGQSSARAILRASLVAQYMARASPPSTRMAGMPYAGPLQAMPSPAHQNNSGGRAC